MLHWQASRLYFTGLAHAQSGSCWYAWQTWHFGRQAKLCCSSRLPAAHFTAWAPPGLVKRFLTRFPGISMQHRAVAVVLCSWQQSLAATVASTGHLQCCMCPPGSGYCGMLSTALARRTAELTHC